MIKRFIQAAVSLSAFVPAFALAATAETDFTPLQNLIGFIGEAVGKLIPIAISAAILFFIWGLAKFILAAGDEKKREEGKNKMIWGVVAIFVIVSIVGIVKFMGNLIGVGGGDVIVPPKVIDNS